MKLKKLTLISLTLLALILGGALISGFGSTPLIAEQVKIEPKPFDLDNPDGVMVSVKLSVDDVPVVDQINASTVLLEGFIAPTATGFSPVSNEFVAQFDGEAVADWLSIKISHMGLETPRPWVPIKVPLKITGLLYDGTPWEGTGEIKVYLDGPKPPPEPPPP